MEISPFADRQSGKLEHPRVIAKTTISIRNKLRYLQGALSTATQAMPPDLKGSLVYEDKNQERDGNV
ncbi:hypothetical protein F5141DRAFT_675204 [Pisolithus sp. B1]|nr:hypothetical protein F5141DRAFT_675204 [Pisolithus sp. B1]